MEHATKIQVPSTAVSRSDGGRAFTLVELLVVIGIIVVLISMLLPSLNKAREAAKTTACLAHLQQIGVSMAMYVNDYRGWPAVHYYPLPTDLPYGLGYHDLLSRYTRTLGWTPDYKYQYLGTMFGPMSRLSWSVVQPTIWGCPADQNDLGLGSCGSYSYNIGLIFSFTGSWDTANHWHPASSYKDTSNTALMVCGGGIGFNSMRVIWYFGDLYARRNDGATANHNKGTNILFCDGHAAWARVDMNDPEYFGGSQFAGYMFDPTVRVWPVNLVYDPTVPTPIPRGKWHIP